MNARLLLLALGTFSASTEAFMIAGIPQPIARDLNISIFSVGQFVTVFSLAYAIGSPHLDDTDREVGTQNLTNIGDAHLCSR
jgi:predicted MFS family arabinose efflux permease